MMTERDISSFLHPTLNELRKSIKLQNKSGLQVDLTEAVMKVVVGYLGTIEMPKENQVSVSSEKKMIYLPFLVFFRFKKLTLLILFGL